MGLNIITCVKSVINNILPGSNRSSSANMELNPFDRPAVEIALSLIKEHGGNLTVVSMGPKPATFGLYQAISIGADRAILICDPSLKESDTYITAKVLGRALQRLQPFDLVLFGTRTSDSDTGHVGPQTAQMLDIPFIGNIHSLALSQKKEKEAADNGIKQEQDKKIADTAIRQERIETNWIVERKADGYIEKFEVKVQNKAGSAFSVSSAVGGTDFTSLYGIERAFTDKSIECWDNSILGLTPEETGLVASPTKIVAWNKEKRLKRCLFIDGTPEQKAENLAQKLSEAGFAG
ncbi:MAG: electron transfer flavoprotein subunit beta/FixA family protein [Desulfamplus sp.]|nr:electron transfer flavoprotein subunit beta/FixA family protein [Desulfamplus sp.]